MKSEELFTYLNKLNLSDLIPLKNITGNIEKQVYITLGYGVFYTLKEWQEHFPKIDSKFIFYPKDYLIGAFYYDADQYALIEIPIQYTTSKLFNDESIQDLVLSQIQHCHQLYLEKNWSLLLKRANKALRLDLLKEISLREKPSEKLYEAFISTYTTSEYGFTKIDNRLVERIISGKSAAQIEKTMQAIADLPEIVSIYRGGTKRSRPNTEAFSWTLSLETAKFFATRFDSKQRFVVQGKINKSDIIERISNEQEILVNPQNITEIRELNLSTFEG